MSEVAFYNKRVGILGGGQLGKMLCIAASDWHLDTSVLDPTPNCPASLVSKKVVQGDFTDFDAVYNFGKTADIITIEIENVNTEALIKLKSEGKIVHPDPLALQIIQDKGLQKEFYKKNNLPTSAFLICDSAAQIKSQIQEGEITFPFVQKLRKAGYDGKGVAVLNTSDDLHKLLEGPSIIEQKVSIKKELAVIAARDVKGNVNCFTPVEMVFDETANLVKYLLCPAQISESKSQEAIELATKTINAFGICGLLAVEMFLDDANNILINEVAPRPHNSGHHTIENAYTSQYEQLLRAILGAPVGSTKIISPAAMVNILGAPGFSGPVIYQGLEKCMEQEGVKLHLYGKKETKSYRKMGHITILDKTVEGAKKKAEYIDQHLKTIA